jgi:hypothetical protein
MFKNKPLTLLIAAGLMILLVAAAGVYPLLTGGRGGAFGRMGALNRDGMQFNPGQRPGNGDFPSGGNPPSGFTPPEGFNRQGTGQYNQNGTQTGTLPNTNMMNFKLLQLLQVAQNVGAIIIIALGFLSIFGIMLGKGWGRKLAITTSILTILFTVASMFSFMVTLNLVIKGAVLALSIAILVLCFLPKSRATATVPA